MAKFLLFELETQLEGRFDDGGSHQGEGRGEMSKSMDTQCISRGVKDDGPG